MRRLQDILDHIAFESLPPAWTTFNLAGFSKPKRLWDYQQEALENALKALWRYYEDFVDYQPGEANGINGDRKERLFQWYRDNGLEIDLDIPVENARRDIRRLLEDYYPVEDGKVAYEHFVNRIGFWMATGSGKTLVLVKLIELLWRLTRLGEIPPHDILVLTYRADLIEQFRLLVDEFNGGRNDLFIRLRDLREYPEAKRESPSLFKDQEMTVFYYRSDNLSEEQKEVLVDFRTYDGNGEWYILLDEAHKGDREDSKRQQIYSILARNGFLFNFSATFTDQRDKLTTAYDFNLARFIKAGYGKHISILKQENRAFRDDENYTEEEKQKVVLQSLLMLTHAHKAQEALAAAVGRGGLYHKPLLLTLVNQVNTKDADLKLFFRELERIGKGKVEDRLWDEAKEELWAELRDQPELLFEDERFAADHSLFESLSYQDVLACVYNAPGAGETEVLVRPSNRKELAFKLKSAERPFALIKIGDISGWLKGELAGYEVNEGFEDEGFFERLNADDSDINILMGSRSFYEGWDSNRPNVITYINIGMGTEAQKFILQSVGRGVRIEPIAGQRKRLLALYNAGEIEQDLFHRIKGKVLPLETLLIFGTNRSALQTVIERLDLEKGTETEHEITLAVNETAVHGRTLLIPVYRWADRPLMEQRDPRKFEMAQKELALLTRYVEYLGDDRLMLARHGASPRQIDWLQRMLTEPGRYFRTSNGKRYGDLEIILPRVFRYSELVPKEVEGLKTLQDEIRHFRHIKVLLKDIGELQATIEQVAQYPRRIRELKARHKAQQLPFEQLLAQAQSLRDTGEVHIKGKRLEIRRVANHYYVPVILTEDERADYIRHIIKTPSEVRFIRQLGDYLAREDHRFEAFDWWLFSKLDESLDEVYIPYYDPNANRIREFHPDFIFWFQKGKDYRIAFVDPKGMQQTGYQHKIDGYKQLFLDPCGARRTFSHDSVEVQVFLFLYTDDANRAPEAYREYWFDSIAGILNGLDGAI